MPFCTKLVAPLALGAMPMTSVVASSASAAPSFNPALKETPAAASVDKVWWRGGGWRGGWGRGYGWRGYGYRGFGVRFGGYGWRGGGYCFYHPRACY